MTTTRKRKPRNSSEPTLTKRVKALEEHNDYLSDDWRDLVADVAHLARAVRAAQDKLEAIEVRRPICDKSSGQRPASWWHRFIGFMGTA